MKKILIASGVVAVSLMTIYFVMKPQKITEFRRRVAGATTTVAAASDAECKAQCNANSGCKACSYGYDQATGQTLCKLTIEDPYTTSSESANNTLYIKRDPGTAASSWSVWSPPVCPTACGTSQVRQCEGAGRCPGVTTRPCPCVSWDTFGSGWYPRAPSGTSVVWTPSSFSGLTLSECQAKAQTEGATAYKHDGTTCSTTKSTGIDRLAYNAASTISGGVRSSSNWAPLPQNPRSLCTAGMTQYLRTCPSGSTCSGGISTVICPTV